MKIPDTPTVPKKKKIVLPDDRPKLTTAATASFGDYYWTAQSAGRILCSPIGVAPKGGIVLRNWCQDTQEWLDTPVEGTYKLLPIKEGTVKIPKGSSAKSASAASPKPKAEKVSKRLSKQLGVTTKKGPDETWGIAFLKLGLTKNAPAAIVAFMKKEFPTIDKKWESWVNHFRQLYNNGKLGQPEPKEPIALYGGKRGK